MLQDDRLEKHSIEIDYRDKQSMLRRVAAVMQNSDRGLAGNFIPRELLQDCLTDYLKTVKDASSAPSIAMIMIDQLRNRNFILCLLGHYEGNDAYAFVHRTFLEYFCATEIKTRFDKRGVEGGLSFDALRDEVFAAHWQDESWHEVLRLIIGMIDPEFAGKLIQWLLAQEIDRDEHLDNDFFSEAHLKPMGLMNLLLAVNCVGDVRERRAIDSVEQQVLQQLQKGIEREYPYQFSFKTAKAMVQAVSRTWVNHPQLLDWLKQWADLGSHSFVPRYAVEAIATLSANQPETLTWLKTCAQNDQNEDVRRAAVQALAQKWNHDPDACNFIKICAQNDRHPWVRRAAVQALAQGWNHDSDVHNLIKTCAQNDQNEDVRRAAVQALAQKWNHDPDAFNLIKTCAQNDQNPWVRRAAVQALAQGWNHDSDVHNLIKTCAQNDQNEDVRRAAVQALAQKWNHDPDAFNLIKTCAQNDQNPWVRGEAVQALAQGWCPHPHLVDFFRSRATHDPFKREYDGQVNPRQLALEVLLKHHRSDPQTMDLLIDRSLNDPDPRLRKWAQKKLATIQTSTST